MKLLVCGGAGFIGSNFIHFMLESHPDYEIVNYDKLTYAGNLDNLESIANNPNYHFEQGDITDLPRVTEVIKQYEITHLINFAAETHVDRSIYGGIKDFVLTNSLGVQMLLDATRATNLQLMLNVSTDEVYGALGLDEDRKFTEDTPIMPNMPYAAAKAGGDLMCHAYSITHKTPVIVTHCSNNYGAYQYPEKLIPFFIFKAMNDEAVPVYGDGLNVRDWIHALDHSSALDLLLHKGNPGEVYNIGVDNERNNLEITKMILGILGKPESLMHYVQDRPGHDRRYAIDASKIMNLGWKPKYTREMFETGLKETVQWYLDNADWVTKIRSRMNEINQHIKN
ncbi:MAG: dTDP-glucose 4,6-dehydratase [bacterium]